MNHDHEDQEHVPGHKTQQEDEDKNKRHYSGSMNHNDNRGDKPGNHVANAVYKSQKEEASATYSHAREDWAHNKKSKLCRGEAEELSPELF